MGRNIILTITMLVSDREDTIEKCMLSLKNLMKNVPSELIIVNTANNEKCMEIVKQYTDKIVPFQWCDDFAAARNAGLEQAKGQWIMFLDDDEWFESTKEIEEFFVSGTYKQYGSAAYITRNYKDYTGTAWSDRIAIRLCKLNEEVKFRGKIHEYLGPMQYPTYYTKDYVHHYGYIFKTKEESNTHVWRNMRPLLEQRKEKPDDFQIAGQLLQEYLFAGESYSALDLAKEMRNHPQADNSEKIGFTSYAMVMEIKLYQRIEQYQTAYETCKAFLKRDTILVITRGCLLGLLSGICYRIEKYEEALNYIEEYEKIFKVWQENPKLCVTDFFSMAEQMFNEDEVRRYELLKLSICTKLKNWGTAKKILSHIQWNKPWKRLQIETPKDLVEIFLNCKELSNTNKSCIDAIKVMLGENTLCNELFQIIDKLEKEEKKIVLSFVTQIEPENYDLLKYHLEYNFMENNKEEIERLLFLMLEKNYSIIIPQEDYWKGLNKLEIDITSYINKMPIEEYLRLVGALYAQMKLEVCEEINQVLWKQCSKEDIRYRYINAVFLEKELFEKQEEIEIEEIWKYLLQISKLWLSCAQNLYQPEVFENEYFSALPGIYRFSWWIIQGEIHKNEIFLHMKDVAEAAKCYLPLSYIVKKYLSGVQKSAQNAEFVDLSKKVKSEIRKLMKKGKMEEAEMVLNQILIMLPNDEECLQLQGMIQNRKEMDQ